MDDVAGWLVLVPAMSRLYISTSTCSSAISCNRTGSDPVGHFPALVLDWVWAGATSNMGMRR